MADSTFEKNQSLQLQVMATDGRGNYVPFAHVPIWSSSNIAVARVQATPNGLSAVATGQAPGIADIIVTCDGLTGVWNVEVTGPRIIFQASAPIG